jgi:hypothetical protein
MLGVQFSLVFKRSSLDVPLCTPSHLFSGQGDQRVP